MVCIFVLGNHLFRNLHQLRNGFLEMDGLDFLLENSNPLLRVTVKHDVPDIEVAGNVLRADRVEVVA